MIGAFALPVISKGLLLKIGGSLLGASLLVGSCLYRDHRIAKEAEERTVEKVVTKAKTEGSKRNARAKKIRRKTRQPGALDRLRRDHCRDC